MMTRALALNGANKVYIIGRRKEVLEKATQSVSTSNVIPIVGDVTDRGAMDKIVSTIKSEIGYINVLICNSGISGPPTKPRIQDCKTIDEAQAAMGAASFEETAKTFEVNAVAVWYNIVAFLGLLDAGNKKGNVTQKSQVICTSSIGGFNRNAPGGFVYGQSKAATTHLVKQLATNLVPFDIRSNAIAPGCKLSRWIFGRRD